MPVTSIRLQEELEQPLADLANQTDRSRNWIINQAVRQYIESQQLEQQRWLETLPALESVKQGKSIAASDVEQWLATWGTDSEHDAPTR